MQSVDTRQSKRILRKITANPSIDHIPDKRISTMSHDDSDDDFEIVGCIDAIKWFFPVDHTWQLLKAEELQLPLKKLLNMVYDEPVPATEPNEIYDIDGDGNCYFRCLSYLITGTDKFHKPIRKKLVKYMKDNPKLVEGLGGSRYLAKSLMWTDGMWPTEVEIYASACMLDTDIYTYVDGKWLRFSSSGKLEIDVKIDRAIYLQNKDNVHYDVVLQVEEPRLLPPSRVYGSRRSNRKKPKLALIETNTSEPVQEIKDATTESRTLELPQSSVCS